MSSMDPLSAKRTEQIDTIYRALGAAIAEWSQVKFHLELKVMVQLQVANGGAAVAAQLTERQLIDAYFGVTSAQMAARVESGKGSNIVVISGAGGPDARQDVVQPPAADFDDADDAELARVLRSKLHELHDVRNRYVHDTWYIGLTSEGQTDWSEAQRFAVERQTGQWKAPLTVTAEEIEEYRRELAETRRMLSYFEMRRQMGVNMWPERLVVGGTKKNPRLCWIAEPNPYNPPRS
jgi:hypothetical protein